MCKLLLFLSMSIEAMSGQPLVVPLPRRSSNGAPCRRDTPNSTTRRESKRHPFPTAILPTPPETGSALYPPLLLVFVRPIVGQTHPSFMQIRSPKSKPQVSAVSSCPSDGFFLKHLIPRHK